MESNLYLNFRKSDGQLFKNPIFEHYVTQYMENTQSDINESLNLEQFKAIFWENGLPQLIIEIMCHITGCREETIKYYKKI